jgi:hypothetical protein
MKWEYHGRKERNLFQGKKEHHFLESGKAVAWEKGHSTNGGELFIFNKISALKVKVEEWTKQTTSKKQA